MKAPDYLQLTDGRRVRIMFNMNALGDFTLLTGKEITEFSNNKADISTLRTIAWCAAKEGEEADGRKLELNEMEFGRLIDMAALVMFSQILASQTSTSEQKKNADRGSFPRIFRRKG